MNRAEMGNTSSEGPEKREGKTQLYRQILVTEEKNNYGIAGNSE